MGGCTFGAIFGERVRGFGIAAHTLPKSRKGSDFWTCLPNGSDFCMSSQKLAEGSDFCACLLQAAMRSKPQPRVRTFGKVSDRVRTFGRAFPRNVQGFALLAKTRKECVLLGTCPPKP